MNDNEPTVAMALLTQRELDRLGDGLERVYLVEDDHQFSDLLAQLDLIAWKKPE